MKAADTLRTAADIVGGERGDTHGSMQDNMGKIAALWNGYLGSTNIDAKDVAIMMVMLKAARIRTGISIEDHFVDMAGYAAIAGEVK